MSCIFRLDKDIKEIENHLLQAHSQGRKMIPQSIMRGKPGRLG